MGAVLKLGSIWASALDYADLTGTAFADAKRKADVANAVLQRLYYMVANSSQNYAASVATITVVSGTAYYDLPRDFYRLLKIFRVEEGSRYAMRRAGFEQAHGLELLPSSAATLELNYVPVAPKFHNPPDDGEIIETNFPDGFEDLLAMDIAVRLIVKAEKSASQLKEERNAVASQIFESLEPRDAGEALTVQDVYQRFNSCRTLPRMHPSTGDMAYMLFGKQLRIFQTDLQET